MASLDEVSLAIGALQAQNAQLLKHAEDHERVTATLTRKVAEVSTKVDGLKTDMATVMPVVKEVQNWKQRAIGLSLVGGLVGGGLLAQIKGWFG